MKSISKRSAKSRGFLPGTPGSSHREILLGGLVNGPTVIKICCCGDSDALVELNMYKKQM